MTVDINHRKPLISAPVGRPATAPTSRRSATGPVELPSPRMVFLVLVTISLLLGAVGVASQIYRYSMGLSRTFQLINLNEEASFGTWFSSALLVTAACCCGLIALIRFGSRLPFRWHWAVLGLIFVGLSIDEIVSLHERTQQPIRERFGLGGPLHFSWIVLAIPLVMVLSIIYLKFLTCLPRHIRNTVVTAAVLYVGGAAGVEMLGGMQADAHGMNNLTFVLLAQVEEVMEMLGASTFIYATLQYLAMTLPPRGFIVPDR